MRLPPIKKHLAAYRRQLSTFGLLYCFTFGVVLPLLFHDNKYSIYFMGDGLNTSLRVINYNEENNLRISKAETFLKSLPSNALSKQTVLPQSNEHVYRLAVTIITMARRKYNYKPKYLTQVAARHLELAMLNSYPINVSLMICDVDTQTHKEAESLADKVDIVHLHDRNSHLFINKFEKEKRDYVNCLNASLGSKPDYILLVEDDALPFDSLYSGIHHLFKYRLPRIKRFSYVKFFHPPRLNGFWTSEINRWIELAMFGVVCEFICYICLSLTSADYLRVTFSRVMFLIYFVLLFFTIGRINVLELRKLSPFLYRLVPAPSCCTPAMLFNAFDSKVVLDYLNNVQCKVGYSKDTAMDAIPKVTGLKAWFYEPNSFQHIGVYTTLRKSVVDPLKIG